MQLEVILIRNSIPNTPKNPTTGVLMAGELRVGGSNPATFDPGLPQNAQKMIFSQDIK